MEMLLDLLQEIKDDLKDQPNRADFSRIEQDLKDHETLTLKNHETMWKSLVKVKDEQRNLIIKVGITMGVLGFIGGLLMKYLLT